MYTRMSEADLERSVKRFDKQFGRLYDLRIHNPDNILPGRAIYTANHFHHFDPIFILYAIARHSRVLAHQLAKPDLFRMPVIGRALKEYQAVVTPRPDQGEAFDFDDYERMKDEIEIIINKDEPLSFAYAAKMTRNYEVSASSASLEAATATSGPLTLVKKFRGLFIVPVAVETYQKRSPRLLLRAFFTLTGLRGLFPVRKRHAADVIFGRPIDIDAFLATTNPHTGRKNSRQNLIEYVVGEVYALRRLLDEQNKKDPARSLSLYTR